MKQLSKKDLEDISKPLKSSSPSFWRKTVFWENVKRSCAVAGGGVTYGIHEFGGADKWMLLAASTSLVGAIVSIWFTDNDHNGIVDLFQ